MHTPAAVARALLLAAALACALVVALVPDAVSGVQRNAHASRGKATRVRSRIPEVDGRFEYQYSFKGPHLTNKEGGVENWEVGGNAIPTDNLVRLTTSVRNRQGWIWSARPALMTAWEVFVELRIMGRGRLGGNGIAIWFTKERGKGGPNFGAPDKWDGLGIFFDTRSTDSHRTLPRVVGVLNDGKTVYDSTKRNMWFGDCAKPLRNTARTIVARITHAENRLIVALDMTGEGAYETCFQKTGIALPEGYYFGLSAATSSLADDHDVYKFLAYDLDPAKRPATEQLERLELKREERLLSLGQDASAEVVEERAAKLREMRRQRRKEDPKRFAEWEDEDGGDDEEEDDDDDAFGAGGSVAFTEFRDEVTDLLHQQETQTHQLVDMLTEVMERAENDRRGNGDGESVPRKLESIEDEIHTLISNVQANAQSINMVLQGVQALGSGGAVPAAAAARSAGGGGGGGGGGGVSSEAIQDMAHRLSDELSAKISEGETRVLQSVGGLTTKADQNADSLNVLVRNFKEDIRKLKDRLDALIAAGEAPGNRNGNGNGGGGGLSWSSLATIVVIQVLSLAFFAGYVERAFNRPKKFI